MGMPNIKELRAFVNLKANQSRGRKMVTGEDLRKMHEIAKEFKDPVLQKKIESTLNIHPKYQALSLLLDENSEAMKADPELVHKLVYSGCDLDYVAEHSRPIA